MELWKLKAIAIYFSLVIVFFISIVVSEMVVTIYFVYRDPSEDLHWDPNCEPCKRLYEEFFNKNSTLINIQNEYSGKVQVNWVYFDSEEGKSLRKTFNSTHPNFIVIKYDGKAEFYYAFNETLLKATVDAILEGAKPLPSPEIPLNEALMLAFSLGFFETFSPCLLALLSFILSYSQHWEQFKGGFLSVVIFGIGFLAAAFALGLAFALFSLSLSVFYDLVMFFVCLAAILMGFRQIFYYRKDMLKTKSTVIKLTRQYSRSLYGLIFLGFAFYFLDPCIAPLFFVMLPLYKSNVFFVLFSFSFGLFLPFFLIGLLAGSISKFVRASFKYKMSFRLVSGLILILYPTYLLLIMLQIV
ncbi:MAG: cytochrome c biogenesis protein CcdA [Candidatus Bathyarchaeia archaeon]|nr:cytochrome c biogenesis protein CcdA [Candidatus Bathyarchaeia archaeon]